MTTFVPSTENPSFCFITPVSYLNPYAGSSRTHLVLAHLVEEDATYREYYRDLSTKDHYIMMDNSAYELKVPYSPDKLIELAKECGAHAIVLPDYPFQPGQVTIDAALKFIPMFKAAGFETFFVPQSNSGELEDWINTYKWAAANPDIDIIGMSILGIPNAMTNIPPSYARVVMTQLLIDRGVFAFDKKHHYLGLNAGPALEIPALIKMKALTTVDSSGPVFAAINGHSYTRDADSFQMVKKLKAPVDFHMPRTKDKDTLLRIQHNVEMTVSLMTTAENVDNVWYAVE